MLFLARQEDALSEWDHSPLRLPPVARPRPGHLFVKELEGICVRKELRVEDQGAEKLVFSPVRWQTWLQAEERCLDNTGLYKTMEMLLDAANIAWGPYVTVRQQLTNTTLTKQNAMKTRPPCTR